MFAYCLNNPFNHVDNEGTDAVWIQEKNRAGGFGHSGLLVDNGAGDWYYLFWGTHEGTSLIDRIFGATPNFELAEIPVSGYDLRTTNGVIDALANSTNATAKERSRYVTNTCYLEGDYSATYGCLSNPKTTPSTGQYSLLVNNCAQVTCNALEKSDIRFASNRFIIPNLAFKHVYIMNKVSKLIDDLFR